MTAANLRPYSCSGLPKNTARYHITNFKVYNRVMKGEDILSRIDGVKIWVGVDLTGGNYIGAENIGTIKYESGTNPYVFSDFGERGSSVQLQGSESYLALAEVEVYKGAGERIILQNCVFGFILKTKPWIHLYRPIVIIYYTLTYSHYFL